MFKLELGIKVRDKVTGYTGIVTGRTEWLYGCRRYVVQSQEMKDGKPIESQSFDEDALEVIQTRNKHVDGHRPATTGGPETRQAARPREVRR
jgi:hypothetical protein